MLTERCAPSALLHGAGPGCEAAPGAARTANEGKELFLDRYSELINLTRAGQLVMRRLLESSLQRIERDESDLPIRLFPFAREGQTRDRLIVIDPRVHFGKPIVATAGVSVAALVERIDAGEELSEVARDYELDESEVEEALVYVRAA